MCNYKRQRSHIHCLIPVCLYFKISTNFKIIREQSHIHKKNQWLEIVLFET